MARKAPPRRLELRSSAPEADTLSTELRGRATKFYHIVGAGRGPLLQFMFLRPVRAPEAQNGAAQ